MGQYGRTGKRFQRRYLEAKTLLLCCYRALKHRTIQVDLIEYASD